MIDLKGKVALVTGVGSPKGIGAALIRGYARAGASVVINYRSDGSLPFVETLKEEVESLGVEALIVQCDVVDSTAVANMFKAIMETFGRLDILVNNAGMTKDMLMLRMKEESFDAVIDVNLKGAFLVAKQAMMIMLKQKSGSIINMTSVVGITGNAGQVNYSSSKAGLIGMTKSMAKELAERNIRVNAIAPGFIESDMTDKLNDAQKEKTLQFVPMKKLGTVEDVANVALFLASPLADYVTGQVISVDGGMAM